MLTNFGKYSSYGIFVRSLEIFSKGVKSRFCIYQESRVSRDFCDFFIFCSNNYYSELFSKIIFKRSNKF